MKKLSVLFVLILAASCSSENPQDEISAPIEATNIVINQCQQGYGIFSNPQYDCGWKAGYEQWVDQYNWVATNYNYPQCAKIRIVTTTGVNGGSGTVGILWSDTAISQQIIQQTQNENWHWYNMLAANQQNSDYAQGNFDGYAAGRGQQPYVANDDDVCP